jgi:HEAT repeat protein
MSIQDLILKLSDSDEAERIYAADDLGITNDAAAVEPLVARLGIESSRAVREMIVLALRNIQVDAVLDQAVRLLASEDPFVRNEMASLLQSRGAPAIPWLDQALKHPDPDVRKLALEAGAQIPGTHLKRFFEKGLSDPEPNVVMSAIENLSPSDIAELQGRLERVATTGSSPMLTLACIEALGKLEEWEGLDAFLIAFRDQPELQYSLIGAVGSSGGSQHLPYLESQAKNPRLRQDVINALLRLDDRHKLHELGEEWMAAMATWPPEELPLSLKKDAIRLLLRLQHQAAALALEARWESGRQPDE